MTQGADQGAMAAHGMPADATAIRDREVGLDQRRQFLDHVVVHAVVPGPGLLGGVDVEAGAQAEIPGFLGIVGYPFTPRTGVRRHQHQAQLGGQALGTGLLHEILVGTGQARQPVEYRQIATSFRLGRQIDGEGHVAVETAGTVAIAFVPTAETLVAGEQFETHGHLPRKEGARGRPLGDQ